VDESLKGEEKEVIIFRQLGGWDRENDLVTLVPGMPQFQEEERVLLFLHQAQPHFSPSVTGLAQGKFQIARGPDESTDFVIPNLQGLQIIQPHVDSKAHDLSPLQPDLLHHQTHTLPSLRKS